MRALERLADFWAVRFHPARAYLLCRGIYTLLAFDLWFEMIEHGGRYGIGGFNVAHFAFLDRLLPVPTPTFYVGLLIASGGLSLLLALGAQPRVLRLLLTALYTLSWIISIHDSYQHHYLISWLLVWSAACPELSAEQAREPVLTRGWGVPMIAINAAIVYAFTGISKAESGWRSGEVLRLLTKSRPPGHAVPGKFDGARDLLLNLGLDDAGVWQAFALATITMQWLIAVAYLAAIARDEQPSRLRALLTSLGLLAAFSFHGVAELFDVFEIGLFSYYMLWLALVLLAPAQGLVLPIRALANARARVFGDAPHARAGATRPFFLIASLLSAVLLAALGFLIPLPGAAWALMLLSAVVCARVATLMGQGHHAALRGLSLSSVCSALVLWLCLARTSIPFDYYRRTAGELVRMGQLEKALTTYRLGELYAPAGKSRADKIRELELSLAKRRAH